jgi:putative DNA primase/helicase
VSAAASIAALLGHPQRVGPRKWRCDCPIHHGHSLEITDSRYGRLLVFCWGGNCDRIDILRHIRSMGASSVHDHALQPDPSDADEEARKLAYAKQIFERARRAADSLVEYYLASRGITVLPPSSLRYSSFCPHPTGIRLPAMIARLDNVDGELIGIHRTFLRSDGLGKAEVEPQKAMLGKARGGAVRLGPVEPDQWLIVAEGVESSLSAGMIYRRSAWAAASACGIENLILPPEARKILICADRDENGVGERAARRAAGRWAREGREVRLVMPPDNFSDFNDALTGGHFDRVEPGEYSPTPQPSPRNPPRNTQNIAKT